MLTDDRRAPGWAIRKRVGTDYLLTITPTDPFGAPVIATAVTAPVLVSGQAAGALAASVDPITGVVTVELSAAQSTALGQITGVWELTAVVGGEVQQWLTGPIRLSAAGSPRDSRPVETANLSLGSQVNINLSVVGAMPFPSAPALSRITDPVKSSIFLTNNATPTPVTQNVAAKVLGAFTEGPACQSCTTNGNRITYIALPATRVLAVASVDVDDGNNQTYLVEIRKNGAPVPGASVKVRRFNAIANGALAAMVPLVTGDFVELWITNLTSGSDPIVVDATMALMN